MADLLTVRDLKVYLDVDAGTVKAVDGVSFELREGRTLALVGESGCGKTTTGKALLQLIPPTSGTVRFQGEELTSLTRGELRPKRGAMQRRSQRSPITCWRTKRWRSSSEDC
jgi:peptide/nickel transport system ATP-binding protein